MHLTAASLIPSPQSSIMYYSSLPQQQLHYQQHQQIPVNAYYQTQQHQQYIQQPNNYPAQHQQQYIQQQQTSNPNYNALRAYSVSDFYKLLLSCSVPKSDAKLLRSQHIDGSLAAQLNQSALEQCGIESFGRRDKLLKLIQELTQDPKLDLNHIGAQPNHIPVQQANNYGGVLASPVNIAPVAQAAAAAAPNNNVMDYAQNVEINHQAAQLQKLQSQLEQQQKQIQQQAQQIAAKNSQPQPLPHFSTISASNLGLPAPISSLPLSATFPQQGVAYTGLSATSQATQPPLYLNQNVTHPPFSPTNNQFNSSTIERKWNSYAPNIHTQLHYNYTQKQLKKAAKQGKSSKNSKHRRHSSQISSSTRGDSEESADSASLSGSDDEFRAIAGLNSSGHLTSRSKSGHRRSKSRSKSQRSRRSASFSAETSSSSDSEAVSTDSDPDNANSTAALAKLLQKNTISALPTGKLAAKQGHIVKMNSAANKPGWLGPNSPYSGQKVAKLDRSAPAVQLNLDYIYGYNSLDCRNNLVENSLDQIIYPAGRVVVILDQKSNQQRHFTLHSNTIKCLAQHPINKNLIATGQIAGINANKAGKQFYSNKGGLNSLNESLLAQQAADSAVPYIEIFDSSNSDPNSNHVRLVLTAADRSVRCLAFSGDGKYLLSVSGDEFHCIKLWNWQAGTLLLASRSDNLPIYSVRWNHKYLNEFVTVGKNHIALWNFNENKKKNKLVGKRADFSGFDHLASNNGRNLSFTSVNFSELGYICAGSSTGDIYIFQSGSGSCIKIFSGIHSGKVLSMDWFPLGLITGGADGKLNVLDRKMKVVKTVQFMHKITSLQLNNNNNLLIGTQGGQIYNLPNLFQSPVANDSQIQPIVAGHFDSQIGALDIDLVNNYLVSAGHDNQIIVWDLYQHRLIKRIFIQNHSAVLEQQLASTTGSGTGNSANNSLVPNAQKRLTSSTHPLSCCGGAVAIHPNATAVAVGTLAGQLHIYQASNFQKLLELELQKPLIKARIAQDASIDINSVSSAITALKFSPSGEYLAVGSSNGVVLLLNALDGYRIVAALSSHSAESRVNSLDWASDSTILQSSTANYELHHHSVSIEAADLANRNNFLASSSVYNVVVERTENYVGLRNVDWSSLSTALAWPVHGIFDPAKSQHAFTAIAAEQTKQRVILAGRNTGELDLYKFPQLSLTPAPHYNQAHAHTGPITQAKINANGSIAITAAQNEAAIVQWRIS
jgi:WD40 repeat protein